MKPVFLLLLIVLVFSCKKSDYTTQQVENENSKTDSAEVEIPKPEWRIKQIRTTTTGIKLSYCLDTTFFDYDSLGRFSSIRYSLYGTQDHPYDYTDYTSTFKTIRTFEYIGNTEKLKKIKNGTVTYEFIYDSSNRIDRYYSLENGKTMFDYKFNYNNNQNPSSYSLIFVPNNDTTRATLTYTNNRLTYKEHLRWAGTEIKRYQFEYNNAGNPTYSHIFTPVWKDTLRKIYLKWKPTITPNSKKLKRLDRNFEHLLTDIFYGYYFYFPSYDELLEFDIFNLTTNGELLDSYNFTDNMKTIMSPKMNFDYQLDSNQNINKVIGLVPAGKGKMEMTIEYEKIK